MLFGIICGLSETIHVKKCIEHGASMCGFILFYPKSHRNFSLDKAKELTSFKHSKSNVAVMVQPDKFQLESIKNLNFQYYLIYGDQDPNEINEIKKRYGVKIIKALTIETKKDVLKWNKLDYDIILANINLNVIEGLIPILQTRKGTILLSGLLESTINR